MRKGWGDGLFSLEMIWLREDLINVCHCTTAALLLPESVPILHQLLPWLGFNREIQADTP